MSLCDAGYEFVSFAEYCRLTAGTRGEGRGIANDQGSKVEGVMTSDQRLVTSDLSVANLPDKFVILRHDVDDKPMRALAVAGCEFRVSSSCKASYYFRAMSDEKIIQEITGMGHEVGYHYEDMSACGGDVEKAVERFSENLAALNVTLDARHWTLGKSIINDELLMINSHAVEVRTVSMHGSAFSKYNNLELWKHTTLEEHGLMGETYLSTDWEDVFYLTDTGRRWDGWNTSVRDRIPGHQERWIAEGLVYRTTEDIIEAVKNGTFPKRVMMTVHPQRWDDRWLPWLKELVMQRVKNFIKFFIARRFLIART